MLIQQYNKYRFIYPPRPERKITPSIISEYDNGRYFGQPKYNGSGSIVVMNDEGFVKLMERHNKSFAREKVSLDTINFQSGYRGKGYMLLCGELLNKAKKNENGKLFNQKFIIWDILVYNSKYLLGTTFEERMKLLDEIYPPIGQQFKHLTNIGSDSVYRAPVYKNNFAKIYEELVETDLYEGFVMKRKDAKLALGDKEKNNSDWEIKVRKPTKNYHH